MLLRVRESTICDTHINISIYKIMFLVYHWEKVY